MCREFNIHWDTLRKILEHADPPGYRQAQPRAKRKIGPFPGVIDEILEGDKKVHRKQSVAYGVIQVDGDASDAE